MQFYCADGIYERRVAQRVDLHHCNWGYSSSGGIYWCDIATVAVHDEGDNYYVDIRVRDRVYVGIYPSGEGICCSKDTHCS